MSVTSTSNPISSYPTQQNSTEMVAEGYDAYSEMGLGDFIDLLVTQMQNQDPMDPMDNNELMSQVSTMNEIAANDKLSTSLDSLMLSENLASGSRMINQTVRALDDEGNKFTGQVERVSVEDGSTKLHCVEVVPERVDEISGRTIPESRIEHAVSIENVYELIPEGAETGLSATESAQQLSVASSLIGQAVLGIDDLSTGSEETVVGNVVKVTMEDGEPVLEVAPTNADSEEAENYKVRLSQVSQVFPEEVVETNEPLIDKLTRAAALVDQPVVGYVDTKDNVIGGYVGQVFVDEDNKVKLYLTTGETLDYDNMTNVFGTIPEDTEGDSSTDGSEDSTQQTGATGDTDSAA